MNIRKLVIAGGLVGIALVGGGYALGQVTLPILPQISQNDLIQDLPNGQPATGNKYVQVGRVGDEVYYSQQTPVTAFTITPANGIGFLLLTPAGTLATGTLTMEAAPDDGQSFCVFDTQTQTAITISANTGQTLVGTTPTALVANTQYCWRYINLTASWYRYQ